MQRNTLAALIAGLFTLPAHAQEIPSLDEIVVTATRVATPDVAAPYASEVHNHRMIERSGASSLYEYLAQQTSVNVMPGYGSQAAPLLDMRGYGIADGYQNMVVSVNGRRLNNIDMTQPLIGAVSLADIDRIEITKGSGSVLFGDGATAGTTQIYTRPHTGVSLAGNLGNHGERNLTATAGLHEEQVSLNITAQYAGHDGYSDPDPSGKRDASNSRTWRGGLELRPLRQLKLGLEGSSTIIDARYPSPLTQAQFDADPAQTGNNPWVTPTNAYSHHYTNANLWGLAAEYALNDTWTVTARHGLENRFSDFITSGYAYHYDKVDSEISLQYRGQQIDFTTGIQNAAGVRFDRNGWVNNDTHKDNQGWYIQGQYRLADTTCSLGARTEKIDYTHTPLVGTQIQADHRLNAWDIGINHRLNQATSLFTNYNRGFQAPDIDRFFNSFAGTFNGFIAPAISHTLNLGFSHVTPGNRLTATLFRARLKQEIYYFDTGILATSYNTNLDRTHKYGLELRDTWRMTDTLTANLNYAHTRAIIDQENEGGGIYDGKDLPGVPRHNATLGLGWQATPAAHVQLTHTWRDRAFVTSDFANALSQRQSAYQSTDLALRYRQNKLEWFAAIDNLFEQKNGLWIKSVSNPATAEIYPVNFTRNWRLGLKAEF